MAARKIIKTNDFLIFVADVLMIFFTVLRSNLFQNLGAVLNSGTLDVPMGMEQSSAGALVSVTLPSEGSAPAAAGVVGTAEPGESQGGALHSGSCVRQGQCPPGTIIKAGAPVTSGLGRKMHQMLSFPRARRAGGGPICQREGGWHGSLVLLGYLLIGPFKTWNCLGSE